MSTSRGRYALPPLTSLLVFEAAARHGSLKAAAEELGVTPGAVSHQVKGLERELGVALFERIHRGVEPTPAGRVLCRALESGFTRVAGAIGRIRADLGRQRVTVAATTAVSSLWLTPRLTRFWKAYPDIAVDQQVSDAVGNGFVPVDLRIAYAPDPGTANGGGLSVELFRDKLVPVCSPAFAARHPSPSLARLATLPLVHVESPDNTWTRWHDWFGALGHREAPEAGRRLDNYMIALQCARDDVGVVLGWKRLVAPLLERGELVEFGEHAVDAPVSFRLLHDTEEVPTDAARLLRDWLLESVRAEESVEKISPESEPHGR